MSNIKKILKISKYIPSKNLIKENQQYRNAFKYENNFDFSDIKFDEASDWVLKFAEERYHSIDKSNRQLEIKADGLLRYFGLAIGAAAVFAGIIDRQLDNFFLAGLILGFLMLIFSAILALIVIRPSESPHPSNVKHIFRIISNSDNIKTAQIKMTLIYNRSIVALLIINRVKGELLQKAHNLMVVGLLLLLFSLMYYFFTIPPLSTKTNQESPSFLTQSSESSSSITHSSESSDSSLSSFGSLRFSDDPDSSVADSLQ